MSDMNDLDAARYRRLRVLGAAPYGSEQLEKGTVVRFQSLDALVDADLKNVPSRGERSHGVCETVNTGNGNVLEIPCSICTPSAAMRSDQPIHTWFGLTYSAYLVIPRLALQHMPVEWQRRLVALLEEAEKVFQNCPNDYIVTRQDLGLWQDDPWADYHHGDAAALIAEANREQPTFIQQVGRAVLSEVSILPVDEGGGP